MGSFQVPNGHDKTKIFPAFGPDSTTMALNTLGEERRLLPVVSLRNHIRLSKVENSVPFYFHGRMHREWFRNT
jgi:hypothetical protein